MQDIEVGFQGAAQMRFEDRGGEIEVVADRRFIATDYVSSVVTATALKNLGDKRLKFDRCRPAM